MALVLRLASVPRSTYYSWKKEKKERSYINTGRKVPGYSFTFDGVKVLDIAIQMYIKEIKSSKTGKAYGYKKVTYELRRRHNLKINKKKVRRLLKILNLLNKNNKPNRPRLSRKCKEIKVTGSNQLWQMDIKYAFIAGTRQTAYITSIIDVFDKEIVACSIDLSCTGIIAKKVLIEALYVRNIKDTVNNLVLRTDNGSQFISGVFEKSCLDENVIHERIPVRSPNYNAYIESYHRYLQQECLIGELYWSLNHMIYDVKDFVARYNHERLHSSIGYVPPHEYYLANIS